MNDDGRSRKTGRTILRPAAGAMGNPLPSARPMPQPDRPAGRAPISPQPESRRREKSLEGLGNLLKTKREINGLTRRDVVVKIKIPLDQLEAIEEGRLSSLPPVFAKGFLRAYANELGLDAEAILEDYRQMTGGFKNEPASREPLAPRYVETSVGSAGWRPGLRALVIGALVLLTFVAALIIWPGFRAGLGSVIPFLDRVPGFAAAEKEPESGNSSGAVGLPDNTSSSTSILNTPADDGDFVGDPLAQNSWAEESSSAATGILSPPPNSSRAGTSAAVPGGGGTLTISSRQDRVWVQLVVDGRAPEFFWLRAGQTVTRQASEDIVVTAGQAAAFSVNWNGQDLGPLGDRDNPVEIRFPKG